MTEFNRASLTLELSSYLLEIPDHGYIQHSVNFDWLFKTRSRVLQAYRFVMDINEEATLVTNRPY